MRPIRMIHGFIPGGNVDITARLIAAQMTEAFGQQVIVDGRPGAGGTNGAAIVSRAEYYWKSTHLPELRDELIDVIAEHHHNQNIRPRSG
jgi:tripartite-type tricarboxylate transporter receptor subunit TctC